jgi:hypothetical protein
MDTNNIIRSAYNALGAGAAALLTTYAVSQSWEDALIVGGITMLGALGFRGAEARRDEKKAAV